jgi:uncharacterized cupredoxin-like copper-binding protein
MVEILARRLHCYVPRVLALTTGHKIGLITAAVIFVVFALSSAVLIPRFRPGFPGRGLPLYVLATIVLFAGMMTSVIIFGRESEEAHGGATTAAATTQTTASASTKVAVEETEFKITPASTKLKAGAYELDAKNTGKIQHDLVVDGPGVTDTKTPLIDPGGTATLKVTLRPGTYQFYCSVPGHKQAGMDVKISVS